MPDPKISVIIPAHNAEITIAKCLEALQKQVVQPSEIIVVDDSSTDRTATVGGEYGAKVIPNLHRKGAGGARNSGAEKAEGDILVFTDSDCVPAPDWLKNIGAAFEEKAVGAVAGGYSRHEGDSFIGRFALLELRRRRKDFPDYVHTAVSNNFAVRANIYRDLGGFPEMFAGATVEDMIFSYRIGRETRIRWLRANGVGHHFHETIKGYLRQQFTFGRDTVVAYRKYPMLLTVKTHQGRLIYVETAATGLTALGSLVFWPVLPVGIFLILLLNIPLVSDCLDVGGLSMAIKAMLFIPLRDSIWVASIVAGIIKMVRMIGATDRDDDIIGE